MNGLEKLGFTQSPHTKSYTLSSSERYTANVVQVSILRYGEVTIYISDTESAWCRDMARKAITALKYMPVETEVTGDEREI